MQHLWEGLDFEDEGESINGELKYRGTDFDHKWHDYIGRSVPEGEGNPPAPLPYQRFHQVPYNALAKTPPMGWNSWNKFGTKITDQLVREIADAMVSSGTRDAGYVYVNIDDGWEGRRDASGVLRPNYGCQVRHLHSWGVYSVPAFAPVLPNDLAYAEWYWHAITEGQKPGAKAVDVGSWAFHKRVFGANFPYQNFATMFRAELFDPEHWANVIAQSDAKYVALTWKHHEGFALWPSREASATWGRAWNAVETGPHRDVLGDLSEAVRRKNVRMGYYYSLYEWYNPLWLSDKKRYVSEHMHPQFKDLVTHYKPDIIFSDGEWDLTSAEWRSPELLAWLFNDSPVKDKVVVNDRWGKDTKHKHGGYWTTEYTAGMSGMEHPWKESRGMGFSYQPRRAIEGLSHRPTARADAGGHCESWRQPPTRYRTEGGRSHSGNHGASAGRQPPAAVESEGRFSNDRSAGSSGRLASRTGVGFEVGTIAPHAYRLAL